MSDEEEEKEMATLIPDKIYTLNEKQVKEIISAPISKINEQAVKYDINSSREQRITNAKNILQSRKWK